MYRTMILLLALCTGCASFGGPMQGEEPVKKGPTPACADARSAATKAEITAEDADAEYERECPREKWQSKKCIELFQAKRLAHNHQGDMVDAAIAACEPVATARK